MWTNPSLELEPSQFANFLCSIGQVFICAGDSVREVWPEMHRVHGLKGETVWHSFLRRVSDSEAIVDALLSCLCHDAT